MRIDKKNKYLFAGFLALIFCSYRLAISKTIEAIERKENLHSEITLAKNYPQKINQLKDQNKFFLSKFEALRIGENSIQNDLLQAINAYGNSKLKLVDFKEPHRIQEGDRVVNTYIFSIHGSYLDIENLVYRIENDRKYGEIIGIELEKIRKIKSKAEIIEATFYLRNYE